LFIEPIQQTGESRPEQAQRSSGNAETENAATALRLLRPTKALPVM
jgi:hypothetical protein